MAFGKTEAVNDDFLSRAKPLIERGFHCFPLIPNTKIPPKDFRWPQLATRDLAQIERWAKKWPDANVGISVSRTHHVVIDLDVAKGDKAAGRDSLWKLMCDNHIPYQPTFTVGTPSGGLHLYFAQPRGTKIRNSAGKLGEGIDVRGNGGYVVAPGSVIGGKPYQITMDVPILTLPAKLAEMLMDKPFVRPEPSRIRFDGHIPAYAMAAVHSEIQRVEKTAEGGRNQQLFKSAAALGQLVGAGVLEWQHVEQWLLVAGTRAGLSERECVRTINSGLVAGEQSPRHLVLVHEAGLGA